MSDVNDSKTCSSWLMYYVCSKNEDEFVATTVKLGYPMLTKKMDNITAAAIWQESNISKKSCLMEIKHPQGSVSKVINVSK